MCEILKSIYSLNVIHLKNNFLLINSVFEFQRIDGEIGPFATVIDAFMKQKHRLIWERRQKELGQEVMTH